jgi:proline iminopeptidase
MRRYFDPRIYRVILFDQRGCGRSKPHASIEANTTWHLVRDIEAIRAALGISRWIVFGGSWGATLALIYGITHPDRVAHLVLRGVFLMTRSELDWFYGGGAGAFWPEAWARFTGHIPEDERGDLIAAYHKRLFSGNVADETHYARAWAAWENALASAATMGRSVESPAEYARAFARLENHYFTHLGWLEGDEWILRNAARLATVPGHVVHGARDMICLPRATWRLAEAWPRARFRVISDAAHALSEPGISAALLQVMDRLGADPAAAGF